MPTSFYTQIPHIMGVIEQKKPKTVCDLGCGNGKYGFLIRECFPFVEKVDAVEGFEEYIKPHHREVYNNIMISNIEDIKLPPYDMFLMIDVIEHFTEDKAVEVVNRLNGWKVAATPKAWNPQGAEHGNELEIHKSHWTPYKFIEYWPDCDVIEAPDSWIAVI